MGKRKHKEKRTNNAAYNLPERGGGVKEKITNYIEIIDSGDGDVLFDNLPDDKQKAISEIMQERAMAIAGYKRKTA